MYVVAFTTTGEMAGNSVTALLRGSRRRMALVTLSKRMRRPSTAPRWQWVESAGRLTLRQAAVAVLRTRRRGPASGLMASTTQLRGRKRLSRSGGATAGTQVRAVVAPRPAHGAEAVILGHVVGEQPAGDVLD